MKLLLRLFIVILPWKLKRFCLTHFFNYEIHPTAKIGFSYIYPKHLIMEENTIIGHLNVAIHLDLIHMEKEATIRQRNWITGFPSDDKSHFQEYPNRKPCLIMKQDSAITKQHIIDCTDTITIGEFTSIAGYGTQMLTHSTSLKYNQQSCEPITIGHHCFVGTRSIILPGSILPNHCVLGAGSVLNKKMEEEYTLYGGVTAKNIKSLDKSLEYLNRTYRQKSRGYN